MKMARNCNVIASDQDPKIYDRGRVMQQMAVI